MHNGGIADFHRIKRKLQMSLPDELFNMVNGNTGWSYDYNMLTLYAKSYRFPVVIRTASLEGKCCRQFSMPWI